MLVFAGCLLHGMLMLLIAGILYARLEFSNSAPESRESINSTSVTADKGTNGCRITIVASKYGKGIPVSIALLSTCSKSQPR